MKMLRDCEICGNKLKCENGVVYCGECKGLSVSEPVYYEYLENLERNERLFLIIRIISAVLFLLWFMLPLVKTSENTIASLFWELGKNLVNSRNADVDFFDFIFSIPYVMLWGIIFTFLAALKQKRGFIRLWASLSILIVFFNVYGLTLKYSNSYNKVTIANILDLYSIGFWAVTVGLSICVIISLFYKKPFAIFNDIRHSHAEKQIDGMCQICCRNPVKDEAQFCEECEKEFASANTETE